LYIALYNNQFIIQLNFTKIFFSNIIFSQEQIIHAHILYQSLQRITKEMIIQRYCRINGYTQRKLV